VALIALSATYGAGGSRVAPDVARLLGVPLLDRATPVALAARAGYPVDEQRVADEAAGRPGRLLSLATSVGVAWGTPAGMTLEELLPDEARRREIEESVRERALAGSGVILGRAAAVLLRDDERALRVLLDGPVERRIAQAMAIEGVDRETACRRRELLDRARRTYVETLYGIDPDAAGLHHLVIDSTAIPLVACVELIAEAARARAAGA
jgi:cytidylate kinase